MKKCFLLTLMLYVMTSMWASGIYRFPITVKQPDGTTLTLIGHGDENFHWSSTTDGVIVVRSGDSFYVADIDGDGTLKPSKQLAHNKGERSLQETEIVSQQDKDKFLQIAKENIRTSARRASIENKGRHYTPHNGNVKGIINLVEFSDTSFTLPNPKKSFEYYMNGDHLNEGGFVNGELSNQRSVRHYFRDISFGNFTPSFDVYGPVKLNHTASYYCLDKEGKLDLQNGRYQLVKDACIAADDSIDFSKDIYDADGDGYVDVVGVIYAGYSSLYAGNPDWWMWPAASGSSIGKFDGTNVSRWLVSGELIGTPYTFDVEPFKRIFGIGVFCHELSHCLGLPDIYPTNINARIDNQEMELWDLMDGGEHLRNGYSPPPYTAWERETMGWMTIDTLTTDQKGIELKTVDSGGKAYRFMNPNDSNNLEHFMIENIQNEKYNYYQKGHGLLVYHVNYPSDIVNVSDRPNNVKGVPRMAVVPADGLLLSSYNIGIDDIINPETGTYYTQQDYFNHHAGDPFPGSKGITSLKYDMGLPNYKWYNGDTEVKQALMNITEDTASGIITFDFITDITNGIDRAIASERGDKDGDNRIFVIDGRVVNASTSLPKGIYIQGGRKFVVR